MKVKRLRAGTYVPTRGSGGAAGFDLYAAEHAVLCPEDRGNIGTGMAMEIAPGWHGRVAPRSGLARRRGIDVLGGIIDSDYRGEVIVMLINHGKFSVDITPGDRIAQIIIGPCWIGDFEVVEGLDDTGRGDGGFGSTER